MIWLAVIILKAASLRNILEAKRILFDEIRNLGRFHSTNGIKRYLMIVLWYVSLCNSAFNSIQTEKCDQKTQRFKELNMHNNKIIREAEHRI